MTIKKRGFTETSAAIAGASPQALAAMKRIIFSISSHAAGRIKENAPIFSGDLRRDIHAITPQVSGSEVRGAVVVNMAYALRMHEDHYQLGPISQFVANGTPYDTATGHHRASGRGFTRPVRSAAQAAMHDNPSGNTPEGGVGRKYMTRVVDFHRANYEAFARQELGTGMAATFGTRFRKAG